MSVDRLYQKYLVADRLQKVAERAGVNVDLIKLDNGDKYSPDVHLQCSMPHNHSMAANEEAARRLRKEMPELHLDTEGSLLKLAGETSTSVTFEFYTGSGSAQNVLAGGEQ